MAARMIDKCRAGLSGTAGEYHFDCSLDNVLFKFKGIAAEEVRMLLASGASDEEVVEWMDHNGTPRTVNEINVWSDFLATQLAKLFDYLESDDQALSKRTGSLYISSRSKSVG